MTKEQEALQELKDNGFTVTRQNEVKMWITLKICRRHQCR